MPQTLRHLSPPLLLALKQGSLTLYNPNVTRPLGTHEP